MTQKELQKKYKNKKVKINFDKWLGKNYSYANFYQNSVNEKDGNILTSDYPLNATVLTDMTIMNCMVIDQENWKEELESFPFRFDECTNKFLDDLGKELWIHQLENIGEHATDEQLSNINFYMPIMQEWFMWKIYFTLNELSKYLFNKVLFSLAEEIITSNDESDKSFVSWIFDIDEFRKNLNNFCEDYLELSK